MDPKHAPLFVQNDPTILRIVPALAVELKSLEDSVILMQLDFLLGALPGRWVDGLKWVYFSIRDFRTQYAPFWSAATINRSLLRLQASDILLARNDLNQKAYDRTNWYAIGPGIEKLHSVVVRDLPAAKPKEPKIETRQVKADDNRYQQAQALATVCHMDLEMNKPQLLREARLLGKPASEILSLYGPGGPWFTQDFRGQKGSFPTPGQVRQTWVKLASGRIPTQAGEKAVSYV